MLDSLCALIERLRQRMQEYREVLETSEAQTRVSLIHPLLQTLGWPTDDPAAVQVEVRAGNGVADYILQVGGQPVLVLEAKRLGQKLEIGHSAALSYAWELQRQGTAPRLVGVTDGCRWLLYDPWNLKQPQCAIDLADTKRTVPAIALALVEALWRPLYTSGVDSSHDTDHLPDTQSGKSLPPQEAWRPLPEVTVKHGDPPPSRIRFPDGSERELGTWKSLLVEVAEWLVRQGKLSAAVCPIPCESRRRYLVSREPRHPTGRTFQSGRRLANGLWLEAQTSAPDGLRYAKRLLQHVGEDQRVYALRW